MKETTFGSFMFLISLVFLCIQHIDAFPPYTQISLPEGAIARLGKGELRGNMAYSPDGTKLAVANSTGIWIYDVPSGEPQNLLLSVNDYVSIVAWSPDNRVLASNSLTTPNVSLWDTDTGTRIATLDHGAYVHELAFRPDGSALFGSADTRIIYEWDVATAKLIRTIDGKEDYVYRIGFTQEKPDGVRLPILAEYDPILAEPDVRDNTNVYIYVMGKLTHTFTHENEVMLVVFSPDSSMLATVSDAGLISVWDVDAGERITVIRGPGVVGSLTFSRDSDVLVSGSETWIGNINTLRMWDTKTGTLIKTLNYKENVKTIVLSPDSFTLAVGEYHNAVQLFDVVTGTQTTISEDQGVIDHIYFATDNILVSEELEGTTQLWETDTGTLRATLRHNEAHVSRVFISADGTPLIATDTREGLVQIQNIFTGKQTGTGTFLYHGRDVKNVLFGTENNRIAALDGWQPDVYLWNATTANRIATLEHENRVETLALSPDGKHIAVNTDDGVYVWETSEGTLSATFTGHYLFRNNVFSPDSRILVSRDRNADIHLWEPDGTHKATFPSKGQVDTVIFSPDSKTLAMSGWDNSIVYLGDITTGILEKTLAGEGDTFGFTTGIFSPDSTNMAIVHRETRDSIHVWDIATGTVKTTLTGDGSVIESIAYNSDGTILASGSQNGTILLWALALRNNQPISPPINSNVNDQGNQGNEKVK